MGSGYTAAMGDEQIEIERLTQATPQHVEAFCRLIPQLSSTGPPTLETLTKIVANSATYLYVARMAGEMVGSLSLVTFEIPTGIRAWIEDVVVDQAWRGNGIASALVLHAVDQAKQVGALSIDLTSRPSRVEANRLYQRLGFVARETNVYRYSLTK